MKQVLLVFIGGGVGSALRYLVGKFLKTSASGFPWGTFSVNVLGQFIDWILMGVALKNSSFLKIKPYFLSQGFVEVSPRFQPLLMRIKYFLKKAILQIF